MDRLLLALVVLVLASPAMADPSSGVGVSVLGTTTCDSNGHDGRCRIAWSFPATSRAFCWIEEMDTETSSWRRMSDALSTRSGTTEEPVLDGRLYRVVACEDPSGTQSCIASTVLWVPFQPMSADAIPELVDNKRGSKMHVSKKLSLRAQKQQYNVYLMERLMNGIADEDMRSMPPMTAPRFGLDVPDERLFAEATEDEIIHQTVYGMYEARRTGKPAR